MADPLSITTGVVALLKTCITVGSYLKGLYDGAAVADVRVKGLLADVASFTQVLQMMQDTLDQEEVKASLHETGHIGNHWTNLSTSIRDGQSTLLQLQETLEKVNKSVTLLDGPRKHFRLKGALEEIGFFRQQIQSYRNTMQLSLQTVILWNQVALRESTDKVLPNLSELHKAIHHVAFDINKRIADLQNIVESSTSENQIRELQNLRNCVQSAASVVSSTSTSLGIEHIDQFSTNGSEFGDYFPPEHSETMLRWISSNAVDESGEDSKSDVTVTGPQAGSERTPNTLKQDDLASEPSDPDSDLEIEVIQALLVLGTQKLLLKDFKHAERLYENCLSRLPSTWPLEPLNSRTISKSGIMSLLLSTYQSQEKWSDAESLLMEMLKTRPRDKKGNAHFLTNTLSLAEVLLKQQAYSEALLYARQACQGFRQLGLDGTGGVEKALKLLIDICRMDGNHDEADAYSFILRRSAETTEKLSNSPPNASDPVTTSNPPKNSPSTEQPLQTVLVSQSSSESRLSPGISQIQNAQLWRLIDKRRTIILGLEKDLEKALSDNENYRRREKRESLPPDQWEHGTSDSGGTAHENDDEHWDDILEEACDKLRE